MAHTRSQDLEAHFNTFQSNFTETQKKVKQLNANIATIKINMQSPIFASVEVLKQDMAT
jgi:hypothetical protein